MISTCCIFTGLVWKHTEDEPEESAGPPNFMYKFESVPPLTLVNIEHFSFHRTSWYFHCYSTLENHAVRSAGT